MAPQIVFGITVPGPGWADWESECRAIETARCMLGITENRILGSADGILKRAGGAAGVGRHFLTDHGGDFPIRGKRASRPRRSGPVLRRRGPAPEHLYRLRRLHDGLPLQREEHPRPSTRITCTWPRNTVRTFCGNAGGGEPLAFRRKRRSMVPRAEAADYAAAGEAAPLFAQPGGRFSKHPG
jgi:hypothetical protein